MTVARVLADAVPGLVAELAAARSERLYREALELLERPLLAHLLASTGGNQLRAARMLGLTLPRAARRTDPAPLA